jgi:branched-subunit amino acid aminotransferase/4-amino-4-deoxychorismate lyase
VAGLFETIRVRNGQIPFLDAHLRRLWASATALGLDSPRDGIAERVASHANAGDVVIRVTIRDRGERIETRPVPPSDPMRIVFSGTWHEPYPHKTTQRAIFSRARERVVPYRADEVILLSRDGSLAEGCVTSVFFWMGNELCTPGLDLGILPGIGRARLIQLARAHGIVVKEGRFSRTVVSGLPLFLVNSVRGVVDVAFHGDWHRPDDDRTRRLAESFWA